MNLELTIWSWNFELELKFGIWICNWSLGLEFVIWICNGNLKFELTFGICNWNLLLELESGFGIEIWIWNWNSKDISIHLTLPYSGLLILLKVKPVLIKNLSWWSLKKQWKNNSKVGRNSFKGFSSIFSAFSVGLLNVF